MSETERTKHYRFDNVKLSPKKFTTVTRNFQYKTYLYKLHTNKSVVSFKRHAIMHTVAKQVQSVMKYRKVNTLFSELKYWNNKFFSPVIGDIELMEIANWAFHHNSKQTEPGKTKFIANYKLFNTKSERLQATATARKIYKFDSIIGHIDCTKSIEENFEAIHKIKSKEQMIIDFLKKELSTPAKFRLYLVRMGVVFKDNEMVLPQMPSDFY